MNQGRGSPDDPLASDEMRRDEARPREERHRADGWSLSQFRARGWIGAVLVALFGGIAALLPYYSPLVLLGTVVTTITTLLAWLLISLLSRRYTPPLSVHLSSLVFIFVALALLSVSVGMYRPGSGVGARLLGVSAVRKRWRELLADTQHRRIDLVAVWPAALPLSRAALGSD